MPKASLFVTATIFALIAMAAESWCQDKEKGKGGEAGPRVMKPQIVDDQAADAKTAPVDESVAMPERRKSFDLTAEQAERFKKFLPKTYAKLVKRDPVHMAAIGDSVVDMYMYDDARNDWLRGYPAGFGKELARQFYYTGDLRIIRPAEGRKQKDRPFLGPEITLRSLGRGGKLMIHGMQTLSAFGLEHSPDVVMVSFGINDSFFGLSLATFARALQEVIDAVRAGGAELVLLSPTMTADDPPEHSMAMNRPYADTMREIAADNGVLFVDLGDLAPLITMPEEADEPAMILEQTVKQYRRFFNHGDKTDLIHPRPELHEQLGARMFKELINGPKPSPWSVSGGAAAFEDSGKFTLTCQVKNEGKEPLELAIVPLVPGPWKPADGRTKLSLKPGESKTLMAGYVRGEEGGRTSPLPSHEPLLRLPVLFSGGGMTRIEEVRAAIRPLALLWKLETLRNQQGSFALENLLASTSPDSLKGSWTAEWRGQKKAGSFSLEPRGTAALDIKFDLPDASANWRQMDPVKVEVQCGGLRLSFDRTIEIARNIGLKQTVALSPVTAVNAAPDPGLAAGKPAVTLKTDADNGWLFLTYEITGVSMENAPDGKGAFGYDLSIDARSFGKRLGFGATDALRLNGEAADGPCAFGNPQPWAFGIGYAAQFDPAHIKAQLGSGARGERRFNVAVPRSYLYLHEWALGNGNSQIGLNTALMFWQSAAGGGGYPPELYFSLAQNGRHRDDAENLIVLELTDKPTGRWTVNPF